MAFMKINKQALAELGTFLSKTLSEPERKELARLLDQTFEFDKGSLTGLIAEAADGKLFEKLIDSGIEAIQ